MSDASDPAWFVARDGRVTRASETALRPAWDEGGTYTLVLSLPSARTLAVGALGRVDVPGGAYAYTGSALGAGGFARVDGHRKLVAGARERRHWHVDSLTTQSDACLDAVFLAPGRDLECAVARVDGPVDGFGASDCDCRSHLGYDASTDALCRRVAAEYERTTADSSRWE